MEENSKREILNNLEKLHDMVEDNDPNNQDQAVSEVQNIWFFLLLFPQNERKMYHKVASSRMSRLVALYHIFRLFILMPVYCDLWTKWSKIES